MGRRQSPVQIFALFLLLLAALVIEGIVSVEWMLGTMTDQANDDDETKTESSETRWEARHFTHGVAPILLASFISGLAGALSQKNLQAAAGGGRNPYLFSMELCAASVLVLAASLVVSPDGQRIWKEGFWDGWTFETLIPIATNSAGGIVVGLVTKYAGSVRKGFALIFGMLLSGVLQNSLSADGQVTAKQWIGGVLAAVSLYLHATNPPSPQKIIKQD